MTLPATARACPYVGRQSDRFTRYLQAHGAHHCHAVEPVTPVSMNEQARWCFGDYERCPRFARLHGSDVVAGPAESASDAAGDLTVAAAAATAAATAATKATTKADRSKGAKAPRGAKSSRAAKARRNAKAQRHMPKPLAVDDDVAGDALQAETPIPIAERARRSASRRSFEEWTVYIVGGILVVVLFWVLFLRDAIGAGPPAPVPNATIAAAAAAMFATETTTSTPAATDTPQATRPVPLAPGQTAVVPTPVEGGLNAALSPSERGVGSFSSDERIGVFGERELNVGSFDGRDYVGAMLFPLNRLPERSRIEYVALELAGLSDANLGPDGIWTVEMLDPAFADDWGSLTYESLVRATAKQVEQTWLLRADDLEPRKVHVLEFNADTLDTFIQRLEQGKVAFRITGPRGSNDNLFAFDTGYGEGFGTRPVLRVSFVPPPPTAGPQPGLPTALPLIVWVSDPTPAPTTTALPAGMPDELVGKILFLTDRFGQTRLMVYDPEDGRMGQVTQDWVYKVARERQREANGVSARVIELPCGSGATAVVADEHILEPADPARRCAQIEVDWPDLPHPIEITDAGFVHYDPVVSPDGEWIAYVSQITGGDELFKIRRDGSANTRLTDNVWEWDKHPSWSPDGSRIAFWSNRNGHSQLYIMNADGSDVRNISNNDVDDWDPVWVR